MPCAHAAASGMCGLRAAGDLVARMQISRKMRLPDAKTYVAERLMVGETTVVRALSVLFAQLLGLGIVWIGRFLMLDRWLFKLARSATASPEPIPARVPA